MSLAKAVHGLLVPRLVGDFLVLALFVVPAVAADASNISKIAPLLIQQTAMGGSAEVLIVLRAQADLSGAANLHSKGEKGQFVYQTLRSVAERSQASLRKRLEAGGIPYDSYYIVNAIKVNADSDLLNELAARDDVDRLEANPQVAVKLPHPNGSDATAKAHPGPEWNVVRVKAPKVWAMGYTGEGIVVASADTGVKWDHPALESHYRGWNGTSVDHDYNWHDATSQHSPAPVDPNSHGTFTTSEMVGDDGKGNQVGVAPGAKWIACRNMDQNGNGKPSQYIECFQYFLAPYPYNNPQLANPALAPDAINNSWDCPKSEGCSTITLQAIVAAVRAAGIFPVMAAGNSGPGCSTINIPPSFYADAVSVGATDFYTNRITMFSSRGPVSIDRSGRRKPQLSAPGDYIRAAVPYDNGYQGQWEGTSMAAPHVTGGVALLWQAEPSLVGNIDSSLAILEQSATAMTTTQNCGGPGGQVPNNVYGYGMLNLRKAVRMAQAAK